MRPVCGSVTTTDPLYGPSACTAARRTTKSSPFTESPDVESANVGVVHGLRTRARRRELWLSGWRGMTYETRWIRVRWRWEAVAGFVDLELRLEVARR